MSDPRNAYDREEEELIDDMNEGRISQEDGRRALRDLQDSYRESAHEAAQREYEREMERW